MPHALFPFVLTQREPRRGTPIATLSDGIHVALVRVTSDGDATVMFREDLLEAGLDPGAEYLASRDRLVRLVRARLVRMRRVRGPRQVCCLVFEHSFLAASCAVLPDLFELASRELGEDSMLLAIPRRDLLVVAPNGPWMRRDLGELLQDPECIFNLDPCGPSWVAADHADLLRKLCA